jgi:hypothetical protein
MMQGMLPDGFYGHVDAVMLAYSFSSFGKRVLSSKVHHHSLQALRVASILHCGTQAEWPQLASATSQAQNLFLKVHRTIGREPGYFF